MATLADLLSGATGFDPRNPPLPPPRPRGLGDMALPARMSPQAQPPGYGEGEVQAPYPYYRLDQAQRETGEPMVPRDPQIDDIRRLFASRGQEQFARPGLNADQIRGLMRMPNFPGFTGGTNI